MSDRDELQSAYRRLGKALSRVPLANLATPVRSTLFPCAGGEVNLVIKEDNRSSRVYGGNKVRKLEYLFGRAKARGRETIATFGTVGSHHALATAIHARAQGFASISFLSHQPKTAGCAATLNMLLDVGSQVVPFRGKRPERISILRRWLRGRRAMVIPAGGSSWLGTLGFVNAGLEVAAQIGRGECERPERVYVATGTMGTSVGLALGFALAGVPIEVHAIRISHTAITDEVKLAHLAKKTTQMMRRLDPAIPADLDRRMRLKLRHEFFAGGYAQADEATLRAINVARSDLNLRLEATYTGKAMAALLADLGEKGMAGKSVMFWQTYHARPLPVDSEKPLDKRRLPKEFLDYFS